VRLTGRPRLSRGSCARAASARARRREIGASRGVGNATLRMRARRPVARLFGGSRQCARQHCYRSQSGAHARPISHSADESPSARATVARASRRGERSETSRGRRRLATATLSDRFTFARRYLY
jgi:hypothetical protein